MILLTGFEPFGGESFNPSWAAAQQAADALAAAGLPAMAVLLPVEFGSSGEVLAAALAEARTHGTVDLVVAVGQAGGTEQLALERVAVNIDDARIPDNAGHSPIDVPVAAGGPAAYFATLPVKACLAALSGAGIPAGVSQTAGTFVCNHVFYALMHQLSGQTGTRGGFVHVPYAPEQVAGGTAPSMDVARMARGLEIIARTALGTTTDIPLAAGATH